MVRPLRSLSPQADNSSTTQEVQYGMAPLGITGKPERQACYVTARYLTASYLAKGGPDVGGSGLVGAR